MEKDNTGFIWLGTPDGLNRFDGLNTKIFRFELNDPNCICGNEVMDIVNDNRGNLWVATHSCLNKLNLKDYTFTHYGNEPNDDRSLSGNYISKIKLVNEKLCVITENGLDILNIASDEATHVVLSPNAIVKDIEIYHDNDLLVATTVGLFVYDFELGQLIDFEDCSDVNYIKDNIQRALVHEDLLFISYDDKILKYDLKSQGVQELYRTDFLINREIRKWNDLVWFCTYKGPMTYDLRTQEFKHGSGHGYPDGQVIKSFIKSDSEIWFSLKGKGVFKYSNQDNLFKNIKIDKTQNGLSDSNNVWHLNSEGNQIIVSTIMGMFSLDKNEEIQTLSEALSMDIPFNTQFGYNISSDENNIWISTFDAGIYHINLVEKSIDNYSNKSKGDRYIAGNTVRHSLVLEVLDNEVLFSTNKGLFSLDKETYKIREIDYIGNTKNNILTKKINYCIKDNKGKLWIGTESGLFVQENENQFSYFSTQSNIQLSNNRIRNIHQKSDSIYLIGTSSGLNVFNFHNKTIEYIGLKEGLKSDVIYSLELDNDSDIWVATSKGISLINSDIEVSNFYLNYGMQENKFLANSSLKTKNGDIYFGGMSGITKFSPSKVKKVSDVHVPFISKLEVLEHGDEPGFVIDYPLTDSYKLTYEQCNFIISFSAINYCNAENTVFYYKLDGYDHEWIRVEGDRELQFMNLKEGTYTFEVQTALRNGELSNNIASLELIVVPPLYKSLMFRICASLLLLLLAVFAYRVRVVSVRKSNVKLKGIVEDQTKRLKRANDLQKTFLQEIPEPLVIFNTKNELTFVNQLFSNLVITNEIDSSKKGVFETQITNFLLEGVKRLENENIRKSESEILISDKCFYFKFNKIRIDDKDYGVVVLIRDITKIRDADRVLKQNENLFRSYFEESPIGIIYATHRARPLSNCNSKFCEMVGMDKSEVLSKTMMDLTYPEDLESDIKVLQNAFKKKERYLFQPNKRLVSKDGKIVLVEAQVTFIYNEEEEFQYLFVLMHDVTEQRINQTKLIEAQTQLMQSEKLASIGQITAGVAHEINNPVNFIYNGVKNLNTLISKVKENPYSADIEVLYEDIQQMMKAIEDGSIRTAEIVKSLKLFTRDDIKNMVSYDVVLGLESTLTLLSNKINDGITIQRNYGCDECFINCYPGQLNQVFMNVILNAIESIDSVGRIEIKLILNKSTLHIIISDTGSGIDKSIENKIFEPFFSTKGPINGTGLGLSISQSIIGKHNGSITFSANEPTGTVCTIVLNLE